MANYVYVVVSDAAIDEKIRAEFPEGDRLEFSPGVWFVRSPLVTSAEVRDRVGIRLGGQQGIVIAAIRGRYTGVANAGFVEKLQVWQAEE